MPLYDEASGVVELLDTLGELVRTEGARRAIEVVLVDDGSQDGTWEAIGARIPDEDARWRRIRHDRNRGLTAALRTGTEAARYELVGWLDADLTYDPVVLRGLAEAVDAGADLALASCHHPDGRMEGVPPLRSWLSRAASALYRLATRHALRTFTCMVRVQPRALALATWPELEGFLGVTEQLLRVLERDARVAEVPAVLRSRRTGRSKMRVVRAAWAHLKLIVAARRGITQPRRARRAASR